MTEQVVAIAIGAAVAAFVLRPLLRGKGASSRSANISTASAGGSDELAELELDREMGRVSEVDYQRWRAELERATPAPAPADQTAVVVAGTAMERAEELVRQWRNAPRPACPNCGLRPEPGARYCSNCGAAISS
jgi:cytochrome c-type biogenesis protein CcmI